MKKIITAALLFYSSYSLSASIEIVSGNLNTGRLDTVISAGFNGSLTSSNLLFVDTLDTSAVNNTRNIQIGKSEASVQVDKSGFIIDASAEGNFFITPDSSFSLGSLPVTGDLVFNVKGSGFFDYTWSIPPFQQFRANADLLLQNKAGDNILVCASSIFCDGFSSGALYLSQGEYRLTYSAFVEVNGGTTSPTDMNFTFQASPVPVPAAIWLFLSGFVGLFVRLR